MSQKIAIFAVDKEEDDMAHILKTFIDLESVEDSRLENIMDAAGLIADALDKVMSDPHLEEYCIRDVIVIGSDGICDDDDDDEDITPEKQDDVTRQDNGDDISDMTRYVWDSSNNVHTMEEYDRIQSEKNSWPYDEYGNYNPYINYPT